MSPAPVTPNNIADLVSANRPSKSKAPSTNGNEFARVLDKANTPHQSDRNQVAARDRDAGRKPVANRADNDAAKPTPRADDQKPASKAVTQDRAAQNNNLKNAEESAPTDATKATDAATPTSAVSTSEDGVSTDTTATAPLGVTTPMLGLVVVDPAAIAAPEASVITTAEDAAAAAAAHQLLISTGGTLGTPSIGTPSASTPTDPLGSTAPGTPVALTNLTAGPDVAVGSEATNPSLLNQVITTGTEQSLLLDADSESKDALTLLNPVANTSNTAPTLTSTALGAEAKVATATADAAAAKAALDSLSATKTTDPTQNATAATKLVSTAMQSEPYRQVVNIVAPLKQMGDGDYTMTLKLHPEHLGSVEIVVALQGGHINLSMNSDNAASRQMLRDSMNDLRSSLEESGLSAGSFDIGSNNKDSQQGSASQPGLRNTLGGSTEAIEDLGPLARFTADVPTTAVTDGPLDVRV